MASDSDYLTAVEIEAIEAALAGIEGRYVTQKSATELEEIAGKLLRHLRALTAPADGEALGRELWAAVPVVTPVRWEDLEPWLRDRYRAHALKCHAIGHAAGALSREGEIAPLRSELARWHEAFEGATPEEAAGAIRDKGEEYRAEIARLTAELAEAHDETTQWAAKEGIARTDRDIAQTESARLKRRERDIIEACERVADGGKYRADIVSAINRIRSERDAARADGARVEREACVDMLTAVAGSDRTSGNDASALKWAIKLIGDRGDPVSNVLTMTLRMLKSAEEATLRAEVSGRGFGPIATTALRERLASIGAAKDAHGFWRLPDPSARGDR